MTATTTERDTGRGSRAARRVVLDRAAGALRARRAADVDLLVAGLDWAHAHEFVSGAHDDLSGLEPGEWLLAERAMRIAGEGTPRVREFAASELGGALGLGAEAAQELMADALDLAHRLPRLWRLTREQRIPAHLARLAATESRDLDVEAAGHADRLLVWQPRRLNPHRVTVLVHEARLYADPDRAAADHDDALAHRRVDVRHDLGAPGASEVFMTLDTPDAATLDDIVTAIAAQLAGLGDTADLSVRRARAVGILADPQATLTLLGCDPTAPDADRCEAVAAADDVAHRPTTPLGPTTGSRGATSTTVVLHVSDTDLLTSGPLGRGGVATSTRLGPVLLERLAGWLIGTRVTIKPVLDPRHLTPVDHHDPPSAMADAVRHRDLGCVFPGCRRPARSCDLDHIDAHTPLDQGGPPAQTSINNLACLCRRHHRAKTFGDFTYHRRPDGSYHWTLPTGHTITTDPPPPRPQPVRRPAPPR